LLKNGVDAKDLEKDGKKMGSLKLFTLFIDRVLKKENPEKVISPLFVLNDLRQLHGHLANKSFDDRYNACKERLSLTKDSKDFDVFKSLVSHLIVFYQSIISKTD
jgi:hypothetical protein